jgi:hypothetical protein
MRITKLKVYSKLHAVLFWTWLVITGLAAGIYLLAR